MQRRIVAGLGLCLLLFSCRHPLQPTAQELARSLPEAEPMDLFNHSGNAAPRKRVTLNHETRDAFILSPGQELVDKRPVPAGAFLSLAAGVIAANPAPLPGPLPKIRLSLFATAPAAESHQLILTLSNGSWLEQVFNLDDFAGQNLTIRIQVDQAAANTRPAPPDFAFAISNPNLEELQPRGAESRLNLILINIDTLRPSHLGRFGYPRHTSPFLDRLAQEGVLFEQTLSQASWTPPSVGTLFTSLYPPQHGSLGKDRIPLAPGNTTLAETLRQAGYRTAAFSASPFITPDYGFGQGFEVFGFETDQHAPALNARAIPWLQRHRDQPFFLYLMYFDPHHPYQPPHPFNLKFQNGPDLKPLWNPEHFTGDPPRVMKLDQSVNPETFEYLRSQYDGEIAAVDQSLADLFGRLRAWGLLENSVVIITSDHGEEFLDHGRFGHGRTLYEEMLRVLLLVRAPNLPQPGLRVTQTVRVLDIMPTALELLGVPPRAPLEGKSLVPFFTNPAAEPDREAFASMQYLTEEGRTARSLRQGNLKLILSTHPDRVELYDLSTDPAETRNLAPQKPEQVRDLTDRITALEKAMPATALGAPLNPPATDTQKLLKSLGYVQ
jgi:arylsulfatase A-like enzyme